MKKIPLYLSTIALVSFPMMGWSAVINGTVLAGAPGTVASEPVVGATVVMSSYAGGSADSLGSATTNSSGVYTFPAAPNGPVEISVNTPGYSSGALVVAINNSDSTLTENFSLTDSSQSGNISSDANIAGQVTITGTSTPVPNTNVYLRRRATATSAYVLVDSALSDANGVYVFDNILPAGTVSGDIANAYTVAVSSFYDSANTYAAFTSGAITVADAQTAVSNIALTVSGPASIKTAFSQNSAQSIRFSTAGDQLLLDLGTSNATRTVSIFGMDGTLQRQVTVPGNESRTTVPAIYAPANGFLFRVK